MSNLDQRPEGFVYFASDHPQFVCGAPERHPDLDPNRVLLLRGAPLWPGQSPFGVRMRGVGGIFPHPLPSCYDRSRPVDRYVRGASR